MKIMNIKLVIIVTIMTLCLSLTGCIGESPEQLYDDAKIHFENKNYIEFNDCYNLLGEKDFVMQNKLRNDLLSYPLFQVESYNLNTIEEKRNSLKKISNFKNVLPMYHEEFNILEEDLKSQFYKNEINSIIDNLLVEEIA